VEAADVGAEVDAVAAGVAKTTPFMLQSPSYIFQ
jgi:hypothetical protein